MSVQSVEVIFIQLHVCMFQKHIIEWVPIDVGDIKANNLDSVLEGDVGLIINSCDVQDAIVAIKNLFRRL